MTTKKKVLEDEESTAVALYVAARMCCGLALTQDEEVAVDVWEPETLRMHFSDRGYDVPEENVQAIFAARTARTTPSFLWDANVFENTVLALNAEPVDPGSIQYVNPPQIAWALEQCNHLVPGEWSLDYEPVAYVVASCIHYGLSTCPTELSFAREELERMTPHQSHLREEVKKRWSEIEDPTDHPYAEDEVGVQLALLASVSAYVEEGKARLKEELGSALD